MTRTTLLTLSLGTALIMASEARGLSDQPWQMQVTICKAGPILSGWDKTCRHEWIRCKTGLACLEAYQSMPREGEQIVWIHLHSPERP